MGMKRTLLVLGMVLALAMSSMAAAGMGNHPHDKATGDITWEAVNGAVYETVFNAHEGAPGSQPDRGYVTTTDKYDVETTTELDCVIVEGDEAFFSGTNSNGDPVIFWARDNAQPGGEFGQWTNPNTTSQTCEDMWRGGGTVLDGNLTVFSSTD